LGQRGLPNMFDLIMNRCRCFRYELGNFKAISADVLINPELSDFTWVEYYRSDELMSARRGCPERPCPQLIALTRKSFAPMEEKDL